MDLGLTGKNALITGGSHGIGLAIAKNLAEEGCNVAICARNKERLANAVEELKAMKVQALGVMADVLKSGDIETVVQQIIQSWHTVHVLVNNVGGGGSWGSNSIEETKEDVWIDVYNKNAMAAVRFTRLILPYMRKQKWGRVITISSIHGREGGGRPWYNMAKSAEISFMKSLALNHDLVRDGITFNSVAPGSIMIPDTYLAKEYNKDPKSFQKMVEAQYPLGRLGTTEEVASLVAFLCSQKASLINGASITVDGSESRSF